MNPQNPKKKKNKEQRKTYSSLIVSCYKSTGRTGRQGEWTRNREMETHHKQEDGMVKRQKRGRAEHPWDRLCRVAQTGK